MKASRLFIFILLSIFVMCTYAEAIKSNGIPFQDLQNQIDNIELKPGPQGEQELPAVAARTDKYGRPNPGCPSILQRQRAGSEYEN